MKTFLFTYRSFTTPEKLLKKLIQYYNAPIPKGVEEEKYLIDVQQPIRHRVCAGKPICDSQY